MQIVIDIKKREWEYLNKLVENGDQLGHYERLLVNGTPLPKGHGRLIDADKTISNICGSSCGCRLEECGYDEPCFSVTRIESAPTIIEADKES